MRAALTVCITALGLALWPDPAPADDVHCPPHLGSVTIDGNVLVAAPCRLEGTVVIGNVHLYAGGSLVTRAGTRIGGNIQAERADFVDVLQTHVGGSIQLDDLVGDESVIDRATVDGSIQLNSNRSRIEVRGNTVGSDVQVFGNGGLAVIEGNRIDGNLQCKENEPPPVGGDNVVQGNKEDQCANLQPEQAPPSSPPPPAESPAASGGSGGGGGTAPVALLVVLLAVCARRICGSGSIP